MGKLCSSNIVAQINLFLGVLPSFLGVLLIFPHTQTLMSSILNSFSFTTSIECQEKLMKQGSVRTNATEHATSAHGTATELATSGKNPQLETMFQEACSSLPPKMQKKKKHYRSTPNLRGDNKLRNRGVIRANLSANCPLNGTQRPCGSHVSCIYYIRGLITPLAPLVHLLHGAYILLLGCVYACNTMFDLQTVSELS